MRCVYLFRSALAYVAVVFALCACSSDDELVYSTTTNDDTITIGFSVALPSMCETRATEMGTDYENEIDTYRIFLYDTDNYYIGEVANVTFINKRSITYYYEGEFSRSTLVHYDNIKAVFIANWPYYTATPTSGSTIDDLCDDSDAYCLVPYSSSFDIEAAGVYCPLYGVSEEDDIHLDETMDNSLTFQSTIYLVRAYAKVEIIFDDDVDMSNVSVAVGGINISGWCAPKGVYHQDDYVSGRTGSISDAQMNANGRQSDLTLQPISNSGNTYYAYLCEQNNKTNAYYAYIRITYNGELYDLYFANYTDGTTTAYSDSESSSMPDRLNIIRNNLYRFYVSYTNKEITVTTFDERAYYWMEVHESSTNATFTGSSGSGPGIVTN